MDEENLESALEQYREQLSHIDVAIAGSVEAPDDELVSLRANMQELVTLTEESLMSLKKGRLLQMLNSDGNPELQEDILKEIKKSSVRENISSQSAAASSAEEEDDDDDDDPSNENVIVPGSQCRAPFRELYGGISYHNAIIIGGEPTNGESIKVRVLFTHPTFRSMVPCQFYLNNRCKFSDSDCKASHGHVVDAEDLDPYEEPDYTLLTLSSRVLVKQDDDLWHPGAISAIVAGHYQIKLDALNKEVAAGPQELFPLVDDDEDDDELEADKEGVEEGGDVDPCVRVPSGPCDGFGEWEKYTTGIGLKLLQKMGFSLGKGLGRKEQGIHEPIQVVVLPRGKSLDVCADLRRKQQLKKQRKKQKARVANKRSGHVTESLNVFEFINQKLGKGVAQKREALSKDQQKGPEGAEYFHFEDSLPKKQKRKRRKNAKERRKSEGNLNVKVVKIQEEIKSVRRKLAPLEQSLARNEGRDRKMEAHIREKMAAYKQHLTDLISREKQTQEKLNRQSSDKKLRLF